MNDKIISFDLNTTKNSGAAPITLRPAQPQASSPSPASASRLQTRAKIAAVYASFTGEKISASDIVESLQLAHGSGKSGSIKLGLDEIAAALKDQKLNTRVEMVSNPTADHFPALAEMVSGQIVLVLGAFDGGVFIYDTTCTDNRAEVPNAEFSQYYAGRLLRNRLGLVELAARHLPELQPKHWFWGEFPQFRRQIGEVATASFVANLLAVAVSLFSMQVYDRVIPYESAPTLWVLALGAMLAISFEGMLKLARSGLMDMTGKRIEMTVQQRLISKVLGMKSTPGQRSPSQIFSAMREFGSVREFFTATTIGTVADLPFILIFVMLIASIGGNLVWLVVMGGILMVLPGFLFQGRMVALTAASQGAATRSARLLYEAIFESETLTTQRGEDRVRRIWTELSTLSAATSSDQRHLTAKLSYWAAAVQQVTYVGTVMGGAFLVFSGDFTVGTVIAVGILTGRTLGPLGALASTMAKWTNVKSALDGLEGIINAEQAEEQGRSYLRRDRLNGVFELREVEFKYDEKSSATVEIPGLMIPAGQAVAVLGANGSGKSTFLRMMAGLYEPSKGRILLDGVDMGQIHPRDLRRNIGYLGQEVRLVAGTLRDNLNLSQLEREDDRLYASLDFAGLGPFVRNHPRGLDLEIKEMGEGLSVGQRQSIGWARIWLQDPVIAILDEPTAALDQVLESTLVSRLHHWIQGRTVIIATHRIPILQLTQRTVILQGGRLAVDGPRDAVLAHIAAASGAKA